MHLYQSIDSIVRKYEKKKRFFYYQFKSIRANKVLKTADTVYVIKGSSAFKNVFFVFFFFLKKLSENLKKQFFSYVSFSNKKMAKIYIIHLLCWSLMSVSFEYLSLNIWQRDFALCWSLVFIFLPNVQRNKCVQFPIILSKVWFVITTLHVGLGGFFCVTVFKNSCCE